MDQKTLETIYENALRKTTENSVRQFAPDLQAFTESVSLYARDSRTYLYVAPELLPHIDLAGIAKRIMTDYCKSQVAKYTLPKG